MPGLRLASAAWLYLLGGFVLGTLMGSAYDYGMAYGIGAFALTVASVHFLWH